MWKKKLAAGTAVLALGVMGTVNNDTCWNGTTGVVEAAAGVYQGTPGGIPYSIGLGYMSGRVSEDVYSNKFGKVLMEAKTFEVNLSPEDAQKYPKLQNSLYELSRNNRDQLSNQVAEWRNDLEETYEMGRQNGMFGEGVPFSYDLSYGGLRTDNSIFSFFGEEYSYLGGAHPNTCFVAYVYDTQSGKQLKLKDVLQDTSQLAEIIVDEANRNFDYHKILPDRAELVPTIQKIIDEGKLTFGMDEDGLVVFFSNYEIGPYAIGTFQIHIPQSKYFSIFNPKYIFYGERPRG